MKTLFALLLSLICGLAWADHVPGNVLFAKKQGLPDSALEHIVGGHVQYLGANTYLMHVHSGTEQAVAENLNHNPYLKYAAVDEKHQPAFTPNDPYYSAGWHFPKIGADMAWDTTMGGGMVVAILDSGADYNHPDLAANLVPGWNFFNNNSDVQDKTGHGTLTASVTAALTNNSLAIASMGGDLKVMPLRITDDSQIGYDSMMVQAINYAVAHGVKLANISYQGVAGNPNIRNAGQYLKDHGGLLVVAAGNNDGNPGYTATTTLIPVSATDSTDTITSFSDYGDYVAMSAPGYNITCDLLGGGYGLCGGTSFSSPITMATLALMMAANPALDNLTAEQILYNTAVDLGAPGRDIYYGYGRVNTAAAVAAAVAYVAPADTQPPSVSVTSPSSGQTVGGTITVSVNASDNVGVAKVTLSINGNVLASDTASPWSFAWDTTNVPDGTAIVGVTAYDAAGNQASASVGVTVQNTVVADTTSPVITSMSPADGSTFGGGGKPTVQLAATASDNVAVTQMYLYLDTKLVASSTASSVSYSWNTKKSTSGAHSIACVAFDAAGNNATKSITVNIR